MNSEAAPTFPAGAWVTFFVMLLFKGKAGALTTKVKKQNVQNVSKSNDCNATKRPAGALLNFMREQFHKTYKQTFLGAKSGLPVRFKFLLAFTLLPFTLPSVYGQAHLRLALTNPNAYCRICHCVGPIPSHLTLHGLWEQNLDSSPVGSNQLTLRYPTDFSNPTWLKYWPNLKKTRAHNGISNGGSFWDHEWDVHGKQICARLQCYRETYLEVSLGLAAYCIPRLPTVLANIGSNGQHLYGKKDIRQAIFHNLKLYVVLRCINMYEYKYNPVLWKIFFCVDLSGRLANCTNWYRDVESYDGCYGQNIILPPAPPAPLSLDRSRSRSARLLRLDLD